jgi:uncharacterized protein
MKPVNLQLKRLLQTSSFTLAIVVFPLAGLALDVKDVPNPRQINGTWVTDMAEILDAPTEAKLNAEITKLEQQNGAEIAVVTVPKTSPSASPKAFTTQLFNYWKIGKKSQNNGVLVLISKGDRRVEVKTGYGIEAILPNAKVANIIDTQITPKFKQGDFNGGTLTGTNAIIVALKSPSVANQLAPSPIPFNQDTTIAAQPSSISAEPTQDSHGIWIIFGLGGLVSAIATAVYTKRRPQISLEPEGKSRFKVGNRVCLCATCKKKMEKVDDSIIQATLSEPEQVALALGSVKFEGWKCSNCSQQLAGLGFHKVAYQTRFSQFCECPNCQEFTVTQANQTLQHPTEYCQGRRLITEECHYCDYHTEREETISCLASSSSSSDSSSSYNSSDSGSSYSSSSDSSSSYSSSDSGSSYSSSDSGSSYSSSDSGSSFGGGSSGDSGAGGSW